MTYKEIYEKAANMLDRGEITLGDFNKMVEPLNSEVHPEPHWIPVTERLPEEPFGCLVTVMDTNPMTMEDFENILPYFVGWDGEQWNDGDGQQCPFEVIAWIPLPEPYKGVTT